MNELDRRQFVKKAGIGAAGAGALWVAPSVVGYNTAFAGTSCLQKDTLDWTATPGAVGSTPPPTGDLPRGRQLPRAVTADVRAHRPFGCTWRRTPTTSRSPTLDEGGIVGN